MDLDSGLYYDYQRLLDTFGQFRGFKELLKIDELFTRFEEFNLFGAKSIVVKLDVPSNISLLGIDDLLVKFQIMFPLVSHLCFHFFKQVSRV